MSSYRKALLFTAVPIILSSLISLGSKQPDLNKGLGIAWLIAGDLWLLSLLAYIGFRLKKRREIASGILTGAGIGLVFLGVTVIIFIALHEPG